MEKIYSRFRMPNSSNLNLKPAKKIFVIVIIILIIAYATALTIINSINPSLERQSKVIAKRTAEKYSSEACQEVIQGLKYEDLCKLDKDNDGNVTLMNMNVINVNKVSSEIAIKLQEKLNESDENQIKISMGSLTGNKILAGRGPKIHVKLELMGNVQTSIKSEIKEVGINQSLHKIYLSINSQMSIISPYKDTDEEITTEVLLAESVIIGKIPETYYDLDGLTPEDALNVID